MNNRSVAIVPMRLFELHKEPNGMFIITSELSMLKGYNLLQPLYTDAMDKGFAIRNEKTNKIERFYVREIRKDDEGDLMYYTFGPEKSTSRVIEVKIFND